VRWLCRFPGYHRGHHRSDHKLAHPDDKDRFNSPGNICLTYSIERNHIRTRRMSNVIDPAIVATVIDDRKQTDAKRTGVARFQSFNDTVNCLEDAAMQVATFGDAKPGTPEHDVDMPLADAEWRAARESLYAWVDDLVEVAYQEGQASVHRRRRIH
jgi:hypothetical protein